ncbi:hypothetical protein [Cellulomonas sp. URHE0023]|uniref:hypothetical protein n=1 Tax=Cellulomonas sp. URHE0023 TaxID=1380354 RepID=UPI0004859FE3|nr:hypothetical protein [Cellulomonas sp. URHE0023]
MTTYGDLVSQAAADLHTGFLQFMINGFDSPDHARNVIGAHYDTLCTLRSHTWALIDPQHVRTNLLVEQTEEAPDDIDRYAAGVFTSIRAINPRRIETPYPDFDFTHPWLDANQKLNAAADLLATHVGPHLSPRSEFARLVLEDERRQSALGTLAELTELQLAAQQPLGHRAIQAGIPWSTLHDWLPGIQEPLRRAQQLRQLVEQATPGHGLWDIPLNQHTVRVGQPIDELTDRLARLRHAAWALSYQPEHAMATLRDLAGLGVAVHAHAATLYGINVTAPQNRSQARPKDVPVDISPAPAEANWILAGGRAWQRVGADLHRYLAPAVPDPGIREDVLAVRQLLNDLLPLQKPIRLSGFHDAVTRRLAAVVNGAVGSMARVAEWNAATFSAMAASGAVQVRMSDLTGDEITDSPEIAATKLRRPRATRVEAPAATRAHTIALYKTVHVATTKVPSSAPEHLPGALVEQGPTLERAPMPWPAHASPTQSSIGRTR